MNAGTADLFAAAADASLAPQVLAPDAMLLRGFARAYGDGPGGQLALAIADVAAAAPFRRMTTPGGFVMSVAMTSCGTAGWITDRKGYRYTPLDPLGGKPWPPMPATLHRLAVDAAAAAGFAGFAPDSCLINRYVAGARMTPHQDRNERDMAAPIVSVSLGVPAVFQFGGATRKAPSARVPLMHGDVVVWGGASRLAFHGVGRLAAGTHPFAGDCRINLTFRKAL